MGVGLSGCPGRGVRSGRSTWPLALATAFGAPRYDLGRLGCRNTEIVEPAAGPAESCRKAVGQTSTVSVPDCFAPTTGAAA